MYRAPSENHDPGVRGAMLADVNRIEWRTLAGATETESLHFGHGPVAFIDANDKVQFIAGLESYERAWAGAVTETLVEKKRV